MEKFVYPLNPPNRLRDNGKQMEVLCLGLSRSGTDSLRSALRILGYSDVYHGFVITSPQREDCAFWVPLMRRKLRNPNFRESIDFDSVLGNCEAVVINRRRDVDDWYSSMRKMCLEVFSWPMWVLSWFHMSICWLWWNFELMMKEYYRGDFEKFGKEMFKNHHKDPKSTLIKDERPFLDWSVEDGWEPLCKFLKRTTPNIPFPNGNKGSDQFQDNMQQATRDIAANALRNDTLLHAAFVDYSCIYSCKEPVTSC
ncbi:uncharacterized protein FFUJ_02111 [Fusarium fujikuroi IMI 58289]|uniref:P-loop containing nucleoside triphosphate hydrolase n=1 Tax=Gibberella fujikuroi (strain CBS 195.34 / IMI 58289 / NRRL A-6831) TaxID=1279085 RepID=S0DRI5_GIBF5|nr:uncharacterized protein FFUJ_02111 [Fusarium fujikuroi IMI 58289]KLP15826.1 uncharacterized protein LW94_637 [Fusarium fujikuroi]CCT65189.1 uncharacterized protein FFUJ_02111 [Fusarium fujikuroi IMI 58289]SCO23688.1 uncharacterized protein FFM5_13417 [Fusarium fujikuroi]SCO35319.1 uncharacterized protein FFMR_03844 [Fusarium fujikuroi]